MSEIVKDAAVAKLLRKAEVVKRVLATDDGKEMMKILRAEFFNRLDNVKDEHLIVLNAGRMDAVAYLEMLEQFNPNGR
jgi:hypothetical protein